MQVVVRRAWHLYGAGSGQVRFGEHAAPLTPLTQTLDVRGSRRKQTITVKIMAQPARAVGRASLLHTRASSTAAGPSFSWKEHVLRLSVRMQSHTTTTNNTQFSTPALLLLASSTCACHFSARLKMANLLDL